MNRLATAAASLALLAAPAMAQPGPPPGPGWSQDQDGAWTYVSPKYTLRGRLAEGAGAARALLAEVAAAPAGACASPALRRALDLAADLTELALVSDATPGDRALAADLLLDAAAAAADHGCAALARGAYLKVVAAYPGPAYAAHRRRAEAGLTELAATGR